MPKGKRKGKSDRGRHDGSLQTSDDDSYNDNASVISNYSENKSLEDSENSEDFIQEDFEVKLLEVMDGLSLPSVNGRVASIQSLCQAFIKKYVPDFIRERKFTLCDAVTRNLRTTNSSAQIAAIELLMLLCIQLGEEDTGEFIDKDHTPLICNMARDQSVAPAVRAKCCLALGIIGFISSSDLGDTIALMKRLESIFAGSYLKGDGSLADVCPEKANLHASALSAWTLLLTNLSPGDIDSLINNKTLPSLLRLAELLESPHLDVRLAAGEALALLFEEGRRDNIDFGGDFALDIVETFNKLATDSNKYRAKKDRKQQRATFRDILKYFKDDLVTEVQVKFGREVLVLDSWCRRKQYDALCNILGPGINIHLNENDLLRDIFEITAPIAQELPAQSKMDRLHKKMVNAAAFKARTIARGKNRDKRSDF